MNLPYLVNVEQAFKFSILYFVSKCCNQILKLKVDKSVTEYNSVTM